MRSPALSIALLAVAAAAGAVAPLLCAQEGDAVDWVARFEAKVADMREAGIPVTFNEALAKRPQIPDEENSALVFLQAFDSMRWVGQEYPQPEVTMRDHVPLGTQRSEFVRMVAAAWLDEQREARATIHRGAKPPGGQYPLGRVEDPFAIDMPHLYWVREGARLMSAEAILAAENEKPTAAAEGLIAMRRLAASVDDGVTLISVLVRIAVDGHFADDCERVLGLCRMDPPDLERLAREIDAELQELSFTSALISERTGAYWLYNAPLEYAASVAGIQRAVRDGLLDAASYGPRSQGRARDIYHLWGYMDEAVAIAALPERERLHARERLNAAAEAIPDDCCLTQSLMPVVWPSLAREVERRMELKVTWTALAVEKWRTQHGSWPESLDVLVPELLPEVPQDAFSDDTVGYARMGDGVCVYSLGRDGREDDAVRTGPRAEPYEGWHITFRLLDPELRGASELKAVEEPDSNGQTLLHLAAQLGDMELARRLIEAGWNVNAVDAQWRTPAAIAVESGHEEVAELLREHGGIE